MKRISVVIAIVLLAACAATYQPPTIGAPENIQMTVSATTEATMAAAKRILVMDGWVLDLVDTTGIITTEPRKIQLTPEQCDCGSTMGLPYLKDKRTRTTVRLTVMLEQGAIIVRSDIEGKYLENPDVIADVNLQCVSTGALEKEVLNKIQAAL